MIVVWVSVATTECTPALNTGHPCAFRSGVTELGGNERAFSVCVCVCVRACVRACMRESGASSVVELGMWSVVETAFSGVYVVPCYCTFAVI